MRFGPGPKPASWPRARGAHAQTSYGRDFLVPHASWRGLPRGRAAPAHAALARASCGPLRLSSCAPPAPSLSFPCPPAGGGHFPRAPAALHLDEPAPPLGPARDLPDRLFRAPRAQRGPWPYAPLLPGGTGALVLRGLSGWPLL